jgi:hypothetical protein
MTAINARAGARFRFHRRLERDQEVSGDGGPVVAYKTARDLEFCAAQLAFSSGVILPQ